MPILCVGETEQERDAGEMERKLRQQVQVDLAQVEDGLLPFVVIAYEPIWAIGTGRTATPEQAQEAIAFVRALVGDRDRDAAQHMRILYGGSVNAGNAAELLGQPDIDGALVGGASLDPDEFAAIVAAATCDERASRRARRAMTLPPGRAAARPVACAGGARRLGPGAARPRQRGLARRHAGLRRAVVALPAHAARCLRAEASACRTARWATPRSAT